MDSGKVDYSLLYDIDAEKHYLGFIAHSPINAKLIESSILSEKSRNIYDAISYMGEFDNLEQFVTWCSEKASKEELIEIYNYTDESCDKYIESIKKAYLVREAVINRRFSVYSLFVVSKDDEDGNKIYSFNNKYNKNSLADIVKIFENENEALETVKKAPLIPMRASDLFGANKVPHYLIDYWMEEESFNSIIGSAKAGKTQLALEMAFCVQNGLPFMDNTSHKHDVLYVDFELKPHKIKERIVNLKKFYASLQNKIKEEEMEEPYFISVADAFANKQVSMDDIINSVRAAKKVNKDIKLCIFDCYYSFANGDSNDEEDTRKNLQPLKSLVEDMAVCYVHHTTKTGFSGRDIQDMIYAAGGSGVHGKIVDSTYIVWNRNKKDRGSNIFYIGTTGRSIGAKTVRCIKDEKTFYFFKHEPLVEEPEDVTKYITKAALKRKQPKLYELVDSFVDKPCTLYRLRKLSNNPALKIGELSKMGFRTNSKKQIMLPTK